MYTYTWSARGQLLAESTQGYPVRTFTYDTAGRLTQATVFTLTTRFTYHGDGTRVAVEVVGQGTTTYTLDYAAGNRILAETTPSGTVAYLFGLDCLGELRAGAWLYYLPDAAGLVRQGTDAQGAVTSAWRFDPDGAVTEGPEGPVSHLVCRGVYDWSTGLIYQGGRYFDPSLGLWLTLLPLAVISAGRGRRGKRRGEVWLAVVLLAVGMGGTLTACNGNGTLPSPTVTICPSIIDPCSIPIPAPGCPTHTPVSSPTPVPCTRGTSYAACYDSVPGGTGIMDFSDNDTINEEYLNELVAAIYHRLNNMAFPPQAGKDLRRALFDTPFFNIEMNSLADTRLQYHGVTYKRSEVNYLGQGMWGAAAGEALNQTIALAEEYKQKYWQEPATPGVKFWVTYGYDAYNRLSLLP